MALYSTYTDSPEKTVAYTKNYRIFFFRRGWYLHRLARYEKETITQRVALTLTAARAGADQDPGGSAGDEISFDVAEDVRQVGSYVLTKRHREREAAQVLGTIDIRTGNPPEE